MVTLIFDDIVIIGVYVPNSGSLDERFQYRTLEWDPDFLAYVTSFDKPTLLMGDLNVAHIDLDLHESVIEQN